MSRPWSRRVFLSALALAARAADRSPLIPSEARRYRDPATEFDLLRLTDPSRSTAILPAPPLRSVSGKGNFLLYSSDRSGSMQVYRMDTKSGESRQWSEAEALDPRSVCLSADEKTLLYLDGDALISTGRKTRSEYKVEQGWRYGGGFTLADDSSMAALVESRSGRHRVRVVRLPQGPASSIFEGPEPVRYVRFRPRHPQLVYNMSGSLTLVAPDGRGSRRLQTMAGVVGDALWSADGRALHYLCNPEGTRQTQLREHLPETGEDALIGVTTQFVSFARNADSTVFAGVSGSKASPYVLLLVRSVHRELTVAEHRASLASNAVVVFSPNSQRLYFSSDREGKPAIYAMALERFVEKTEVSAFALRAENHHES